MKRLKMRALSVLLLAAAIVFGMVVYVARFAIHGETWATSAANPTIRRGGELALGTVYDRNNSVLSTIEGGRRVFSEDVDMRRANLHAVGDTHGFIGTGALTVFAPRLAGYNLITGLYQLPRTRPGGYVRLTIDRDLNLAAYRALAGRRGAVMVMNYKTGDVLAMVSTPAFDPQNPPTDIETNERYEGVYLNRALSAAYTPGSVFKLVTTAAALELLGDIEERTFYCDGSRRFGDGTVTCPRPHGRMNFSDALADSCNIAFGEIALELGGETLAEFTANFGLSEQVAVGRIRTTAGSFNPAAYGTDALAWSGIGQYTNTVNPAAMLRFSAAVANGGVAMPMRLRSEWSLFRRGQRIMPRDIAERLCEMMSINTRAYQEFRGVTLHAKSGTAEVGGGLRPHAWFTGYLSDPENPYAFVVVVENGGGGAAVAGEIAREVLAN